VRKIHSKNEFVKLTAFLAPTIEIPPVVYERRATKGLNQGGNRAQSEWPITTQKSSKNSPEVFQKTSATILQFTTIFINFFNFDHFFNLKDEVKGERGARFARMREI
jgi:hypothetical protein